MVGTSLLFIKVVGASLLPMNLEPSAGMPTPLLRPSARMLTPHYFHRQECLCYA
ncbi:MAG TPA: hypothetical protein PLW02_06655 [Verrucomicrobiota bacterium]|nr:hypothetical protein [Verrucomicrobiota bacterium]